MEFRELHIWQTEPTGVRNLFSKNVCFSNFWLLEIFYSLDILSFSCTFVDPEYRNMDGECLSVTVVDRVTKLDTLGGYVFLVFLVCLIIGFILGLLLARCILRELEVKFTCFRKNCLLVCTRMVHSSSLSIWVV